MIQSHSQFTSATSSPLISSSRFYDKFIMLMPYLGFMLGVIMWFVDAFVDYFIINPEEQFSEALLYADSTEMWMRSLVIILFTMCALVVQHFMHKQQQTAKALHNHQLQLEQIILERTQELQHLANFDTLTGVYNRRLFNECFEKEKLRAYRYQQPLSLIICDLDHFKQVNDRYGHNEGDRVLKDTAEVFKKTLRNTDIYARWGGEEFVILLPHTDLGAAEQVADKLRLAINQIEVHEKLPNLTASLGVSTWLCEEQSVNLFKRADDALYQAKQSGRNRVCSFV